ncbi:Hypothetical protein SRAE_1000049900 [Strongyloides ratti]|uniref:Caenorhabditis elegans ly-6-related family-containing protein n=1 Tax=Strongyloides ratti TaxID=34506 RepID=A0A090KXV3_STRRB|nr:Hypothetical protein SRAE_1000049900 [Strongyloides ratti]CEF62226.1 Hypothetical protein SRAE_1000049900 [Strongyloides ratti]
MQLNNLFFVFIILILPIYSEKLKCYTGLKSGNLENKEKIAASRFRQVNCTTKFCGLFTFKKMDGIFDEYETASCASESTCNKFKKSKIVRVKEVPDIEIERIYGMKKYRLTKEELEIRTDIEMTCCDTEFCNYAYKPTYFIQILIAISVFSLFFIH